MQLARLCFAFAAFGTAGSAQTVEIVRDLLPNGSGAAYWSLIGHLPGQREVLVALDDGIHGFELWRTDGTAAGTTLFYEFAPGPAGTFFRGGTVLTDHTWFVLDVGAGEELWRTDGTVTGTTRVRTAGALGVASISRPLAHLDGRFLFNTDNALWSTDGTHAGTVNLGCPPAYRVDPAGAFLLVHATPDDIWLTDGNQATLLRQNADVRFADGRVLLNERIVSGGSTAANRFTILSDPSQPSVVINSTVVIALSLPSTVLLLDVSFAGSSLMAWDGTGPPQVLRTFPFLAPLARRIGDRWVFSAFDLTLGEEPCFTDGTVQGTQILDLYPGPAGSQPDIVGELDGKLLFWALTPGAGGEPWVTDGTIAGTTLFGETVAGPAGTLPDPYGAPMQAGDRRLLLSVSGRPWLVGGPQGLQQVGGVNLLSAWRAVPIGDTWVFLADDGVRGLELYRLRTTGTAIPLPDCAEFDLFGDGREFTVDDPVLGATIHARATGLQPTDLGVAMLGHPAMSPAYLGDNCYLQFDPTVAIPLAVIADRGNGSWSLPFYVTNTPGLTGIELVAQPLFLDPGTTPGWAGGRAIWLSPGR